MSIDSVQIPLFNDTKRNWSTGSGYLPSIVLNNIDEYAGLNSANRVSKEWRNLLFSGHVMSVKFNPITSNLKYCFAKGVVIPQTCVNQNSYNVCLALYT